MAKLYVFGIGGTGSRVLRSLTMLLAGGADTNGYEIVPIIIDPDESNGDLTRNVELLRLYNSIRKPLTFTDGDKKNKGAFFKTAIHETLPEFRLPIKDTSHKTYEQFIGLSEMQETDQAMAQMLFSEKNLASSMEVGFKGNPNVGSVVLNQIVESEEFTEFATSFTPDDRIFVVSSIFGGTGASGFPLLLKTLRTDRSLKNCELINRSTIGAVSVLPYFNLKADDGSEIDSTTFLSKTRAALKYYDKNLQSLNALYYMGINPESTYDNNEGSHTQRNDAHMVELLSASAILDFCHSEYESDKTQYYEVGLDFDTAISLKSLSVSHRLVEDLRKPLLHLALMARAYVQDADYVQSDRLDANKTIQDKDGQLKELYTREFGIKVQNFLKAYLCWLKELKGNAPSFVPFNMKEGEFGELKEFVTDVPAKTGFFSSCKDNDYRSMLNDFKKVEGARLEDKLLAMHYLTAQKFAEEKYKF